MFRAIQRRLLASKINKPHSFKLSRAVIHSSSKSTFLHIQNYYDDLKPSSDFIQDITAQIRSADCFLDKRVKEYNQLSPTYKLGIVLDIDDTSLSHYHVFEKAKFCNPSIIDAYIAANAPAIQPVLKFYQKAISHKISVFFITARKPLEDHPVKDLRPYTVKNLHDIGYTHYTELFMPQGIATKIPTAVFKTNVRKMLHKQGYKIILNIGDQASDFEGGYAEKDIKLPNYLYPATPTFQALVSKIKYFTPVAGNAHSFINKMSADSKSIVPSIETLYKSTCKA